MNNTATYSRCANSSQIYRSFTGNLTPVTISSNFYESTRPLNFQNIKHNMPIEIKGNMLKWNKSEHPATWESLISRTTGAYKPIRGEVMISSKRLSESEQSVRTLQPHLQQPPRAPIRKPRSPSNKENKFNVITPPTNTDHLTKKITTCARIHNPKIYNSDVRYVYPEEEAQRAITSHRPLRRQSCKPAIETCPSSYIGNAGDVMMKDSATSVKLGPSHLMKNLRDFKSSISGLPGSQIRPIEKKPTNINSRANRQQETTYEKFNGNPPTYERCRSAKPAPRTNERNETHFPQPRTAKRYFRSDCTSIGQKQSEELKIQTKMRRPENIRSAFTSTLTFH